MANGYIQFENAHLQREGLETATGCLVGDAISARDSGDFAPVQAHINPELITGVPETSRPYFSKQHNRPGTDFTEQGIISCEVRGCGRILGVVAAGDTVFMHGESFEPVLGCVQKRSQV